MGSLDSHPQSWFHRSFLYNRAILVTRAIVFLNLGIAMGESERVVRKPCQSTATFSPVRLQRFLFGPPTGTGCACLGDCSFDPLAGESVSHPSDWGSAGECLAVTFLHNGTSMRSFNCRRDGKGIACPRDGSMAPQVYALA